MTHTTGLGEYTTKELRAELESRNEYLGDFNMEVGGERFVDHVKIAIKNECNYRKIPMLNDMQIGIVIGSLRNHSYTVLMTQYDRRDLHDQTKVTDFYPTESSVGRFLRDAGNELIDRHENHIRHMSEMVQGGGNDTDATTKHPTLDAILSEMAFRCAGGITDHGKKEYEPVKQAILEAIKRANPMSPKDGSVVFAQEPYIRACERYEQNLMKELGL